METYYTEGMDTLLPTASGKNLIGTSTVRSATTNEEISLFVLSVYEMIGKEVQVVLATFS